MKKILALIIVLCICVFAAAPVFAVSSNVPAITDSANIIDSDDERELEEMVLNIRKEYDCDVAVYTYRFNEPVVTDYEARTHAQNFYNSNGYSDDGILFMIFFESDDDGGTEVIATGKCIDVFTEDDMINMEDNFYDYLTWRSSEGYYQAAKSFISDCDDEFYDITHFDFIWFLIAPAVGAGIAFFIVNSMKSKLKTIRSKPNAYDYQKAGSMNITSSSDVFLYRRVSKVPKPKDNGGSSLRSSGGRSFSGHSGRRF